jgi:2-polyprenyl-6-methoxyphenol hydroxylase-like FAD-dependent oxidoreductase
MRIAINGIGVAGPALAYWLDRAGHQATLIERAPRLRTGGYMIDFWGIGYTVAERMGILPAIRKKGYAVREVRLVDRRGGKVGGFSTDVLRRMVDARFISLPRGDLAAEVYRSVENRVETIFDDSIHAVAEHEQGIRATLRKGDRDFDLVIGADGLHSTIRALTFGPQRQFERQVRYFVAAFEAPGYRPRDELVYVSHAAPGRQVARFAERDDRTLFLFVFADGRMSAPAPEDLEGRKTALRHVFGDMGWECRQILAAMDDATEIYFDRVSQIVMAGWSKGRVALIGDAAACVSLLAGEGTGLALTAAYVLAGELARAGGDHRRAFAEYERRLRPLITDKQRAARQFASSFAPRTALGISVRNAATRLMAIPAIARLLIGSTLRDDLELPDYGL